MLCSVCGATLTDPVSVKLGIGPVCRVKDKQLEANQGNLFAMRSKYSIASVGNVLIIYDRLGIKTVTNDIDNVLSEVKESYGNLDAYKIMYRDSQGVFDGVVTRASKFTSFFSIGETDERAALAKLHSNVRASNKCIG